MLSCPTILVPDKEERVIDQADETPLRYLPGAEEGAVGEEEGRDLQGPADAEIVRRCLAGEADLFRLLVERYQRRAFWVAFNLVKSKEEALDVTQDAFVRAFRSLDRFDVERSFFTWFYRIITNLAIDRLRKRKVSRSFSLDEVQPFLEGGENPALPLERRETRALVREVLDSLPPKFKTVMVLRDIEGISCKEIAPMIGATHATVRWRLHRARQVFREKWERLERVKKGK